MEKQFSASYSNVFSRLSKRGDAESRRFNQSLSDIRFRTRLTNLIQSEMIYLVYNCQHDIRWRIIVVLMSTEIDYIPDKKAWSLKIARVKQT